MIEEISQAGVENGGKALGLRKCLELNFNVPPSLAVTADGVDALLEGQSGPLRVVDEWLQASHDLIAVRSSAAVEDGQDSSYAGMFESELNVPPTIAAVCAAIERVAASGRAGRVRSYGNGSTYDVIPVVLQRMIKSAHSGVGFSQSFDSEGNEGCYIEWVRGFGESLVSGREIPDRFWSPHTPLSGAMQSTTEAIPPALVSSLVPLLHRLRSYEHGEWDVEWTVDNGGVLWILQLRPITRVALSDFGAIRSKAGALGASQGVGTGAVRILEEDADGDDFLDGEVLVALTTEVSLVDAIMRSSAVVTESGGALSHAAIVCREFGIPCVVGASGITSELKNGDIVVVDGATGEVTRDGVSLVSPGRDADLTELYLFDRGWLCEAEGRLAYIEPSASGLTVSTVDALEPENEMAIRRFISENYGHPSSVRTNEKVLWSQEWLRFDMLETLSAVRARVELAIARWDCIELDSTIETIKQLAISVGRFEPDGPLERLVRGEVAAALHAYSNVLVEGSAAWRAYRQTSIVRSRDGISFHQWVSETERSDFPNIRQCLSLLSKWRNEAYGHFSEAGAFNVDYFRERQYLVNSVLPDLDLGTLGNESDDLDVIYTHAQFVGLERIFYDSWMHTKNDGAVSP